MSYSDTIAASATLYAPVDTTGVTSLNRAGSRASDAKLDAVSKDFEAVFLTQMMSQMFAGDDLTAFFGGGAAGEIYKSYMMNEYGKAMANAGGIGIAEQVKKELIKLQESAA